MATMPDYMETRYRTRGLLQTTGLSDEEIARKMRRADGNVICEYCGKSYRNHPYVTETRDWDGYPYLHVLCDGDIVKL